MSSMMYLKKLSILSVIVMGAQAGNILAMFPYPSKSHTLSACTLLRELGRRGHNVTLLSPHTCENVTTVRLKGLLEGYASTMKSYTDPNSSIFYKFWNLLGNVLNVMIYTLKSDEFHGLLTQKPKFDLIIQQWLLSESLLVMGHTHNAPTIAFGTMGGDTQTSTLFNNPVPFAYVSNIFLPYSDDMSFIQRVINTVAGFWIQHNTANKIVATHRQVLSEMFPKAPPLEELMENIDVILLNSHVLTESPRPYLLNMIQIGGFHLYEKEVLPGDVKKFLDDSTEGVIYCNFGANLRNSTMPQETLDGIKKSFSKIGYKVMFKYESVWKDKPAHVFTSTWFPQKAILAHPNVKIFITHGGLGGISEGLFHGVPMLGMPFFIDQVKNVAQITRRGCCLQLNPYSFTEGEFTRAIEQVMSDPKYSKNVKMLSEIYQSELENPLEKAVHWVERVMKFKNAKYLKNKGCSMPWYQFMLVDVFVFLGFIFISTLIILYSVFKCLCGVCRNVKEKQL